MSKETADASRQHRILKALSEHGPLSLPGIRKHVHKPVHEDLNTLRKDGHIVQDAMVPAGPASPVKELPSFCITPKGAAYAAVEIERVTRGPSKAILKKDLRFGSSPKMTTKLTKVANVEITYTEQTKYTTHVPKYKFQPYQPDKEFMECVR